MKTCTFIFILTLFSNLLYCSDNACNSFIDQDVGFNRDMFIESDGICYISNNTDFTKLTYKKIYYYYPNLPNEVISYKFISNNNNIALIVDDDFLYTLEYTEDNIQTTEDKNKILSIANEIKQNLKKQESDNTGNFDGIGNINARQVVISIVDHNNEQDDFYDLYVNNNYIDHVYNSPGETTSYKINLIKGQNIIKLKLVAKIWFI